MSVNAAIAWNESTRRPLASAERDLTVAPGKMD